MNIFVKWINQSKTKKRKFGRNSPLNKNDDKERESSKIKMIKMIKDKLLNFIRLYSNRGV